MTAISASTEPVLHDFDTSRSGGAAIAWVDVQPGGRPRFWDHLRTCTPRSMRAVRNAIAQSFDLAERVLARAESMPFMPAEQYAEQRRRRVGTAR